MRLEDKMRIQDLHGSGRSIASLTREFGVSRSTIKRVLAERGEMELNERCAEMLGRGIDAYAVADELRSGLMRLMAPR